MDRVKKAIGSTSLAEMGVDEEAAIQEVQPIHLSVAHGLLALSRKQFDINEVYSIHCSHLSLGLTRV